MKIICAWCDREMGTEERAGEVRFSVCRHCLAKFKIFPENREVNLVPEKK